MLEPYKFGGIYVSFNQSKRVCVKMCLHHSFFIDLKVDFIFNDILEFIINIYDVTANFAFPPRKLCSISIERWRFDRITVFIRGGSVVYIRSGSFTNVRNFFSHWIFFCGRAHIILWYQLKVRKTQGGVVELS